MTEENSEIIIYNTDDGKADVKLYSKRRRNLDEPAADAPPKNSSSGGADIFTSIQSTPAKRNPCRFRSACP